jgi:molybdate transport system ATP-binding protein
MDAERRHDESWIMHGKVDEGTSVGAFVGAEDRELSRLLTAFEIDHLRGRGLRFLSTGEMRKTLLCRALAGSPVMVVLDDPYDGLDVDAQARMRETIGELADGRRTVVVVTARVAETPEETTHVAYLEEGALSFVGRREGFDGWMSSHARGAVIRTDRELPTPPEAEDLPEDQPVVSMEEVGVSYGEKRVISNIDWHAYPGDVWHILGPNGAGKSTLLSLVDGSNPKAYGQRIALFGVPRGSGESVWEIKRRIGFVSADFHNSYPSRTTARDAVLSGFWDSAGLYERPSGLQEQIADAWLDLLGFRDRGDERLRSFSYGEQRAILVARAMVKMPPLLIADEPSQGLDDEHSAFVLSILDRVGRETATCVLYVSHKPEFTLSSVTHRMRLVPAPGGGCTATIEKVG